MSPDPRRNGNAVASLVVAARIPAANQHQQLLRRIVPFPAESQATTALSFRRSIDPSRDEEYFYHYHPTTNDPHSDGFLADLARFLFALCKLVCWLSVSAVSYAIFYHCVMPSPHVVKELHFDYYYHPSSTTASTAIPAATTTPTTSSMPSAFFTRRDDLGDSPVLFHTDKEGDVAAALRVCTTTSDHSHTSPPLPTTMAMSEAAAAASASKTRPIPTASVDLLAVHNEWQAYFDDIVPTTKTQKQQSSSSLLAKQAYFIEIALHLPESPVNQNAGMFGVVAELYSASSTTPVSSSSGMEPTTGTGSSQDDDLLTKLAVSRRSYRFPYQSPWLSVVAKVLCLIPLLLGAIPESRTVAGQAFRHYIESSEHPLRLIKVKIEQLEESLPIEAIGGILRIGQEYSAFQEILIDWFFACSLLGTLLFAVFYYSLLKLTGWIWKAAMARHLRHVDLEEPPCDLQWDDDDGFEDIYAPFVDCQEDGFPERAGAEHDVPGNLSEEENQIHARVASNEDSYRHFESSENHEDIDRNEEEEDDEWEDLSRNAVDSPTNAYPASPMVGRCMGTVDERTSDSREMTDGELSDFMLRGAFDNRVSTRQSFHTIHSRVKNLSANIDEGEPRQVHPFFFFFSW